MRRTVAEGYEGRSVPLALKMEAGDLCFSEIHINHRDMKAGSCRRGQPLTGPSAIFSCSFSRESVCQDSSDVVL